MGLLKFCMCSVSVRRVTCRFVQGQGTTADTTQNHSHNQREWFYGRTILPGLQFVLAGVIGKPDVVFGIPLIRFLFEALGYM